MRLALFEDHIQAAQKLHWAEAPRSLFVVSGRLSVHVAGGPPTMLEPQDCQLFTQALELQGEAEVWTFELSAQSAEALNHDEQARCILAHDIDLDPNEPVVLRADRVEFPAGMETPKHGHKAGGIRRLYRGRLIAEIGHEVRRIDARDAWFETGHDPVVGRNIAPSSAFVRTMVLPASLLGHPTFIPWSDEEAAKPRGTQRTQYFDTLVTL